MSFPWGVHERQGDAPEIVYKQVPEYQPSSASITIGDPFYGASRTAENITVRRTGLDMGTVALVGIPIGLVAVYLLVKRKKKRRKKRVK